MPPAREASIQSRSRPPERRTRRACVVTVMLPISSTPAPGVPPERGPRPRPAPTGLADRRHAHRRAIRFGYESCPRDDGSPPFFLRALLLALPRGPERVRRIPQRGQAHVAEDLPLLGT